MNNVGAILIDKLPTTDLRIIEVMAIIQVYDENPGITRKEAAKLLGISERTMYRKILDNGLPVGISKY
jgi:transcriptional regulator with PAS, ATPase and Fis domain